MTSMFEEYLTKAIRNNEKPPKLVWAFHEAGRIYHCYEKIIPIFHDWSFEVDIEYNSSVITAKDLRKLFKGLGLKHGFGDFRPMFGQAEIELTYKGLVQNSSAKRTEV